MNAPPASPRKRQLAAHLADARFHLRNAERSLDAARDHTRREASDRELAQLGRYASLARGLLATVARREGKRLRRNVG